MMMVDQAWRKTVLITTTNNRSLIIYFLKSAFLEEKDFDGEEDGSLAKFDSHLTFFSRFLFVPSADPSINYQLLFLLHFVFKT